MTAEEVIIRFENENEFTEEELKSIVRTFV